jgi:hypothetical protein
MGLAGKPPRSPGLPVILAGSGSIAVVQVTEAVGVGHGQGFFSIVANNLLTVSAVIDRVGGAGAEPEAGKG